MVNNLFILTEECVIMNCGDRIMLVVFMYCVDAWKFPLIIQIVAFYVY